VTKRKRDGLANCEFDKNEVGTQLCPEQKKERPKTDPQPMPRFAPALRGNLCAFRRYSGITVLLKSTLHCHYTCYLGFCQSLELTVIVRWLMEIDFEMG
jgi:hypothetical protein